jgi:hypothetical protein
MPPPPTVEYTYWSPMPLQGEAEDEELRLTAVPASTSAVSALILRFDAGPDTGPLHGSSQASAFGALLSLALATPLSPGVLTRYADGGREVPVAVPGAAGVASSSPTQMDVAWAERSLTVALSYLEHHRALAESKAQAVITSAQRFRQAMNSMAYDGELAWLLFISALESGAQSESAQSQDSVEVLRRQIPELVPQLEAYDLLQAVADSMSHLFGATSKFTRFVLRYAPPPSDRRPPPEVQHAWSKRALRSLCSDLYRLRSEALHSGHRFPELMCRPAYRAAEWLAPAEVPPPGPDFTMRNLSAGDVLTLEAFSFLVHGALMNWWRAEAVQ